MPTNILVETHIDSNAIKVAQDHKLPFDEFIPNAKTVKAMQEARVGQLQTSETIDAPT